MVATLSRQLMKSGYRRNVFCSDDQFWKWIQEIQGALDWSRGVQKRDFVEKWKSMVYVQYKTNPLRNPSPERMYHLNMTEHAKHFRRIGGTLEGLATSQQNRTKPLNSRSFPANINVLMEILKLSFAKTIFNIWATAAASSSHPMLRPEQKPISLVGFIIYKFTSGGDMVLELLMGTGATAKACMVGLWQHNFTSFNADSKCVVKWRPLFCEFLPKKSP